DVSTANVPVNTASAKISTASPEVKTVDDTAAESLVYEEALRLQEQLDKEERQRIARVQEEASSFNIKEWDDIQVRVEADEEFAVRLLVEEREKYSEAENARLLAELIKQRKRHFAAKRAEETSSTEELHFLIYQEHGKSYTEAVEELLF
ncbi:hypothetical protein Tco_0197447, partial [Tanacetum coccineum]